MSSSEPTSRTRQASQIHRFPILSTSRYHGPPTPYAQPVELTCFSFDGTRTLHLDDRELKYYYPPDLTSCDLSEGYDTFIQRDDSTPDPIDALLDALVDYEKVVGDKVARKANFVTWRGIITKILCTPYNRNEPWVLGATLWNNTIYMNEHLTSRRKAEIDNATPRHKLMTYWGYKFENLCTVSVQPSEITSSDHPELLSRKSSVVNNNVQYCSVAKAALGKNKIIIGAEVDCLSDVKPEKGGNPIDKYIELKTSKVMTRDKDKINFEKYKLIKYWTQSFLIGIPRIIVGFRDDNGFVKHLKEYKTLEIPRMVRGKRNMWDANVCLNFANNFLSWLRTVIVEDDPRASYLIRFKEPFREIEVIFMGCNGTAAVNERFLGVL